MGVTESRDDCCFLGFCWLYLGHTCDVYEAAVDAVSAAEEGVYTVSGIDFVGRDYVLGECLNDASVREGSGCSECLHRAGPPTFLV